MSGQSRREIVFSARDNGVSDLMSRLRQSANETGRELLREATVNTQSAQDAVKYYEQQVKLLEQKTKLEARSARLSLDNRYQALQGRDGVDQSQLTSDYRSQVSQLQQSTREDALQIELLRELIETVKATSTQEIKAEDKNSLRESSSVERALLASAGGEFTDLSDRLTQEGSGGDASAQRGRGSMSDPGGLIRRVASSNDSVGAVNAVLEQANDFPFVGVLTAVIGASVAALHIRAQREQAAGVMAALSGMSVDSILSQGIGGTEFGGYGAGTLGISREQFLTNNIPSSIRALGTSRNAGQNALGALEIERGMAVDGGTIATLQRLTRVMDGVSDTQMLATRVYSSMYGTGALGQNNTDMARMQDIMQGFASFQESQFMRAGVTGATGTLGTMRMLQGLGGNFGRDDYAFDAINRLNSGLIQGGSPEANAIKFDVLRRANPNKSFFELQMEMEKGINSKGYLSGMFDYVKSTGGDLNSQSLLFDQLTGGSMKKQDINDILSGRKSLSDIDSQVAQQSVDYRSMAINASSGAQTELLNFGEQFKDVMSPIGQGVEELIKLVGKMVRELEN